MTEWIGVPFSNTEQSLAASTFSIFATLGATALAARPFTIVRTIGLLSVRSDQAAAIEFASGAIGGLVVSDKATALGATAIPDPVTEVESDLWFLYEQWIAGGEASTNAGFPVFSVKFDSRAQRKVQEGEDVAFVIANASAADAVTLQWNFRFLVKLH